MPGYSSVSGHDRLIINMYMYMGSFTVMTTTIVINSILFRSVGVKI